MPNRIIKESITTSATLAKLSDSEERHFWRLIVQADDFGYLDARPEVIRARAYPMMLDTVSLQEAESRTQALVGTGLLHLFTFDGKRYGHFPTWDNHQQKRAKYSKYPQVESCDIHCNHVLAYVPETLDIRSETLDIRSEKREEGRSEAKKPLPPAFDVPEDFRPLMALTGYKARNHEKAFANIRAACGDANVEVAEVVKQFAADYNTLRHTYSWVDPVAAFKGKPLAIVISHILAGRTNGSKTFRPRATRADFDNTPENYEKEW